MHRERVLIVEGEKETCGVLRNFLEEKGFEVSTAGTCAATEQIWRTRRPDIAILDYSLSDGNALELIPGLRAIDASIPIIILTGYGSIDLAVEALKLGAELFLPKPAELTTLYVLIQRSLENQQNHRQQLAERTRSSRGVRNPFLGNSKIIRRLADLASEAALSDNPVLIRGEAGTGRGTIARWLHRNGPRASEPFVDVSCGDLPGDLLEIELFGEEHYAFDGTLESKAGLLELAHKGTVFLDEIENVDLEIQSKLLKVVEEKQFRRLEEARDRRVDIRLVAATQQATPPAGLRKQFRHDPCDRVNWIPLSIPPLRERAEDIPMLSAHILGELTAHFGTGNMELGAVALQALQSYSWPGNIRELRNVLERVALVIGKDGFAGQDFRFEVQIEQYLSGIGQFRTLEEMERNYIQQVLRKERGRVRAAAKKLGIPRSSLYHKLKQYKADQPEILMQPIENTGSTRAGRRPPQI
ncbi:MAG TPA: sigma-54 dependent transcriptional regulator [Terriglobales bacterium]|nr:sigma-54 dependent transcriptional regulator [Terriglobales bacterium]